MTPTAFIARARELQSELRTVRYQMDTNRYTRAALFAWLEEDGGSFTELPLADKERFWAASRTGDELAALECRLLTTWSGLLLEVIE